MTQWLVAETCIALVALAITKRFYMSRVVYENLLTLSRYAVDRPSLTECMTIVSNLEKVYFDVDYTCALRRTPCCLLNSLS